MSTPISFYIHSIDFDQKLLESSPFYNHNNQIWCVFSIAGSEPVSTSAAPMALRTNFNYILNMSATSLSNTFLYTTLCCFSGEVGKSEMIPLARSKVLLEKLPLNHPNAFRLPLMTQKTKQQFHFKRRQNYFVQFATILISAIVDSSMSRSTIYSISLLDEDQSEKIEKKIDFDDSSTFT